MQSPVAPSRSTPAPPWAQAALFALAYLVGSEVGYGLSLGPTVGGTFWPPSGIALAVFLFAPLRHWPLLVAAAVVANFVSDTIHGQVLAASVAFCFANVAEPILGAYLLRRLFGSPFTLKRLPEVIGLAIVVGLVTTPLFSAVGAAAAELWTQNPPGFAAGWRTWWIGNAVGALVLTPVVLRGLTDARGLVVQARHRWLEVAAFLAVLVATTQLVFAAEPSSLAMPFLVFPALLWASLRFGLTGVGGSLCIVALLTARDTALGHGPFAAAHLSPGDRLVALQLFLGVIAVSFQVLAVVWEERTAAVRALREANAGLEVRYRRLVEQSPFAIEAILPDGRVKEVNDAWRRLWGPTLPGRDDYNIHDDRQLDELGLRPFLDRAFAGEVVELPELWVSNREFPAVEPHCLRGMAYAVKDEQGRVEEVVLICRDITEQVRAQRELEQTNQTLRDRDERLSHALAEMQAAQAHREELLGAERSARAEAERASRLKDEFLATLSHELRTPLNAILGWAQLLHRQTPDAALMAQAINTIERNARAQARLIEELLDMSRITSGKVELALQRVELRDVVYAAVDSHRPAAVAREIGLGVAVDPAAADAAVWGDPSRLQQVVSNLLSNANKFTPPRGGIEVRLTRRDGLAELAVRDSGEGIAPDFLPHVFERFRQGDGSTTRQHGGLGLGLAIVQQIVEMHRGTITAHSDGPGRGATFTVTLPLTSDEADPAAPPRDAEAPAAAALAGLNVLVVDDEADARELLARLFRDQGCTVAVAGSADEALEHLRRAAIDLLVSDIGMPRVDGYELIRRVRSMECGRALRAVAVTAFARPEDRDRALAAGYDAHLAKPITPPALLRVVTQWSAALR